MTVENITLCGISLWISVHQLQVYSPDRSKIEARQEFLCYFKLSEPTATIIGELFRDDVNKPMLFNSVENAMIYAKTELEKRLK